MPQYRAVGVQVCLAAASLADTITLDMKTIKGTAVKNSDDAEERLRNSSRLAEERVPFPGDEDGFGPYFLKNDEPFMMAQAGADLFKVTPAGDHAIRRTSDRTSQSRSSMELGTLTSHNKEHIANGDHAKGNQPEERRHSTRAHPQVSHSLQVPGSSQVALSPGPSHSSLRSSQSHETEMTPQALSLHIILDNKTFLRNFTDDLKPQHVKIDVLYNGMLVACTFIAPKDIASKVKPLHQVFGGTRVDWLAERPWVLLPPGQNVDGTLRGLRRAIGVRERWEQICAALLKEAGERGFNKYGDRPPSADYLEQLAKMEMPEPVEHMQRPGGRRFGVIDVILTVGEGKKLTGPVKYLKEPTRLRD
ncbi:hypothetical protein K469DRAFT_500586, partial [Zopfia rhizophila CBS 207.26]